MTMANVTGNLRKIEVVDTHTGGEPTRVVLAGGPDLGSGAIAEPTAQDGIVGIVAIKHCQPRLGGRRLEIPCTIGKIDFEQLLGHGNDPALIEALAVPPQWGPPRRAKPFIVRVAMARFKLWQRKPLRVFQ